MQYVPENGAIQSLGLVDYFKMVKERNDDTEQVVLDVCREELILLFYTS